MFIKFKYFSKFWFFNYYVFFDIYKKEKLVKKRQKFFSASSFFFSLNISFFFNSILDLNIVQSLRIFDFIRKGDVRYFCQREFGKKINVYLKMGGSSFFFYLTNFDKIFRNYDFLSFAVYKYLRGKQMFFEVKELSDLAVLLLDYDFSGFKPYFHGFLTVSSKKFKSTVLFSYLVSFYNYI